MFVFAVIWVALFFGYATVGLKTPQMSNPFYWRKKYASAGAIQQQFEIAAMEYGGVVASKAGPGVSPLHVTKDGITMVNNGLRFHLDNYYDLYC